MYTAVRKTSATKMQLSENCYKHKENISLKSLALILFSRNFRPTQSARVGSSAAAAGTSALELALPGKLEPAVVLALCLALLGIKGSERFTQSAWPAHRNIKQMASITLAAMAIDDCETDLPLCT